jgi:phosphate transport system protein
MVRHFEEELNGLRKRLLEMSGLVESSIYRAIAALVNKDESQISLVLQNESRINQMEIEIDDAATGLLVLEQPVASDLRLITSAIKINSDLERMGDTAVRIAERAVSLMHDPVLHNLVDIAHMASLAQEMVRKSLDAFVKRDSALARSVLLSDDAVDEQRDANYEKLIDYMEQHASAVRPCMALYAVVRGLERIADHATNIAEDVLFLVEGVDVRHHAEARQE